MAEHIERIPEVELELSQVDDDILVEGLARGLGYAAAGALTLKSAKTVGRRMADPAFRRRKLARQAEIHQEILGQLNSLGLEAVEVLQEGLRSDVWTIRATCAKMILGWAISTRDRNDELARILELEERLELLMSSYQQ